MNIELVGKDLRPSELLRARLEQKLTKIESRLGEKIFVRVKLGEETNKRDYSCTIHFTGARHEFNATATSDDLIKAADETLQKIERQVRKMQERTERRETIRKLD